MSKKTDDHDHDHDHDEDLEDEETERDEDEDEDEEHEAPARRGGKAHAHDHGHDDHGHDHEDEEDLDDPTWWAPHAVMGTLVILGVLGFFGVFNKALAGIAAPMPAGSPAHAEHADAHPTTPVNAAAHANTASPAAPAQQREEFGAKHFLVQYKGAMRAAPTITRTEDEAKARALEGLKKAKSGVKFEDVVKEYSDEPGAGARGGDLGTFRKGQMVPEFQNAVEKLKVGELSDLVKTAFGYHVILRTK